MMAFASIAPPPQGTTSPTRSLPVREIPGSYGPPIVGPLLDRFQYFVTEGADNFFKTRIQKYNSTVIRVNMPPGPLIASDTRVVMLLDSKSFPTLFDLSKVEKKNVLTGTYMASTKLTGGYRTGVYLDPSEEKHGKLKNFCFDVLKVSRSRIMPEFAKAFDEACVKIEKQFENEGKASFSDQTSDLIFNFLCRALIGADPVASLGNKGPSYIIAWLAPQVAPVAAGILPKILAELTIHTFPIPSWLVLGSYYKVFDFVKTNGSTLLDMAVKDYGLNRDEACHDLVFNLGFNAFGGMLIFFPSIVKYVGKAGAELHRDLVKEVRGAVEMSGGLNMRAVESMPLVKSVVYEVLRLAPPVELQYGRAKRDIWVESHDACYKVKEGELLGGYQPFATKDPKVFANPEKFDARRFVGEDGEKLLQYVLWSNGRETDETTADNKQCAGKDIVVLVGRLLVSHIFLRYDSIAVDESSSSAIFTSLKRAT